MKCLSGTHVATHQKIAKGTVLRLGFKELFEAATGTCLTKYSCS